MRVAQAMTRDVRVALPEMTIKDAATLMAELDVGALPVCEEGKLVGMLTDRDIAVRAVANGLEYDTPVEQIMSPRVRYCLADDLLEEVLAEMGAEQIRRMPVLDDEHRLVGIVSLADAALEGDASTETGEALAQISEPGGEHSQASDAADPHAPGAPRG